MVECELPQRLYLAKGENEENNIYVDSICLPQHQCDGIRFLYKQYKKGKAGVILNDSSGYGKRVQTVLFLNAMRPLMTLPILILCTDGKEQIWTQLFNKWTNMEYDVTVQKSYEIIRPVCVISTFLYISALSRREWGVVVIDDNNVSRDVLRSGLNTKYKIWLTSMDMKKNLQTFSLIYKWFYPKDRFIVEDFQATKKTPSVLLAKSARLDAFMEDIVVRRKDVTTPLGKCSQTPHAPTVSRKNKDATGKKIKRSKLLSESQDEGEFQSQQKVEVQTLNNGRIESNNERDTEFVVNIDNDNVTKSSADFKSLHGTSEHISIIENESVKESDDKDEIPEKFDEMKDELKDIDNNKAPNGDSAMKCDSRNDNHELFDSQSSQNITIKYDSDTPDLDDEIVDENIPAKKMKYTDEVKCKIKQIESEDLFSVNPLPSDKSESENKVINNILTSESKNAKTNEINHKNNKLYSEDVFSADLPSNEVMNEIKTDDLNSNKNELVDKNYVSAIDKTEPKLDSVELKMKQMEELAMKKFKGSFLDKMF